MESTYVSELIEEVRIRVRLKKNDGSVTFRELSEGEQQLLTVLGLLRFTAENESLFLLDEPDTHLNPRWCVDYIDYLKSFVGKNSEGRDNSHIVLTTHNPLAIAELVKEQVQILYRTRHSNRAAENPAVNPKGMGFAGIVTSDMFGLGTSLDKATNDDLLALTSFPHSSSPSMRLIVRRWWTSASGSKDWTSTSHRVIGWSKSFCAPDLIWPLKAPSLVPSSPRRINKRRLMPWCKACFTVCRRGRLEVILIPLPPHLPVRWPMISPEGLRRLGRSPRMIFDQLHQDER